MNRGNLQRQHLLQSAHHQVRQAQEILTKTQIYAMPNSTFCLVFEGQSGFVRHYLPVDISCLTNDLQQHRTKSQTAE
jgi:hypothetical protein